MLAELSPDAGVTAAEIAGLFPMPVSACVATPDMAGAPLFEVERAHVANALPKRQRAFAAGRASARQALATLGGPVAALPVGEARAPVWPRGYVGSITHTDGLCAAVAARTSNASSLGLDAEGAGPLAPAVERLVCQPQDFPASMDGPGLREVPWSKLIFSIKEAFYKCQHPLTGRFLEFDAATVGFSARQTAEGGAFTVAAAQGPRCRGRWRLAGAHVLAAVWPDPDPDAVRG